MLPKRSSLMSLKLKIEYLAAIRIRYFNSSKKGKSGILDELCKVTGYSRKYAIKILALKHKEGKKFSGRKIKYSKESVKHLKALWNLMGQICSKKMVQALPIWVEYYEAEGFNIAVKQELTYMSHATIDRYLRTYKAQIARRKRTGTKPAKGYRNIIPVKDFTTRVSEPGHVEADTVAHCGNSLTGRHIWSLTFTDIFSGWTDNRAIFGKTADEVLSAVIKIRSNLPYELLSFNTDNGTEFLNEQLIMHFSSGDFESKREVLMTRSRAYRKNDNCHVEQKNWTHVREVFGYDRFDDEGLVAYMNDELFKYFAKLLYSSNEDC